MELILVNWNLPKNISHKIKTLQFLLLYAKCGVIVATASVRFVGGAFPQSSQKEA